MAPEVDGRAAAAGSVVGGLSVFAFIAGGFGGLTIPYILTILVMAPFMAGIPAGICVGLLDRTYRGGLNTGGLAAVAGTLIGIFGFAVVRAATIPGLSLAHRVDVVFVVAAYTLFPLMMVFPFIYLGGGLIALQVGTEREATDDLELHDLSGSRE